MHIPCSIQIVRTYKVALQQNSLNLKALDERKNRDSIKKEGGPGPWLSGLSRNLAPDGFSSVFPQMRSYSNQLQVTEIDVSGAIFLVYCTCTKMIKNQINILRSINLHLPTLPEMVDCLFKEVRVAWRYDIQRFEFLSESSLGFCAEFILCKA